MKKALVSLMVVGLVAVAMCGCATAPKGPSDTELINKLVADWKAAAAAKDVDKVMALYSENFKHYEYKDKAGVKAFIKDAIDMGYLDNCEISTDKAKVTIEKDTAKVYPIGMSASFGSAQIELDLTKEAKGWMITSMEVEQM